jgi:hypothetical protein
MAAEVTKDIDKAKRMSTRTGVRLSDLRWRCSSCLARYPLTGQSWLVTVSILTEHAREERYADQRDNGI